ncbi:SMP-30/gluconolactonase/LRE family protein [Herbaspirillum seropedicae]|uniref:SMP-30/gluconolactonase/LRE family protein n=1 Tax=Herbaspirillum seropedicae TaxID=964 RepID=UPI0028554D00|nr:SMP-30/gluconolactonase/LRE family protein [Herbaspirillum seropedicae]MDR6395426.1 sugar lactone lactonase YvrE [Herbaspirillum seropedicae]
MSSTPSSAAWDSTASTSTSSALPPLQEVLVGVPDFLPVCILPAQAQLGECPRWDEQAQQLVWVDILARRLHRYDPASGRDRYVELPEAIGCVALAEEGGYIAGLRSGLWQLDQAGRPVLQLAVNPEDQAGSRFNDGRCDPAGRFLAGTIDEPKAGARAHLYRLRANGAGLDTLADGLLTSNGLAFSPDGRWMYHSDTPNFVIWRRAYDPLTGDCGPRQVWATITPTASDRGRPDGAAVDAEGYYWSAFYEGGRIVRFAPDGSVDASYALPVQCPTMCAFGGPDLRTLFITSARAGRPAEELARQPLAGALFAMRTSVPGCIEPRWRA